MPDFEMEVTTDLLNCSEALSEGDRQFEGEFVLRIMAVGLPDSFRAYNLENKKELEAAVTQGFLYTAIGSIMTIQCRHIKGEWIVRSLRDFNNYKEEVYSFHNSQPL